ATRRSPSFPGAAQISCPGRIDSHQASNRSAAAAPSSPALAIGVSPTRDGSVRLIDMIRNVIATPRPPSSALAYRRLRPAGAGAGRRAGPVSPRFRDHQAAGHHVVQRLLAGGEAGHDEADIEDEGGDDLAEIAPEGAPEPDPIALQV